MEQEYGLRYLIHLGFDSRMDVASEFGEGAATEEESI